MISIWNRYAPFIKDFLNWSISSLVESTRFYQPVSIESIVSHTVYIANDAKGII